MLDSKGTLNIEMNGKRIFRFSCELNLFFVNVLEQVVFPAAVSL